ncbi:hypothetical protein [Rahnella sp. ChDrAdgB13]|uniref:hypothetical protein n=1 Tax=Rahnella sp. ChDrAdgB13 TaxID=1850581 RepID=UPI001AD86E05|nr:hypothetical protein [Rahnella sp. ChDrAdgB13]
MTPTTETSMQYSFRQEEKQFRRIMLDVQEICPRRFRYDVMLNMAIVLAQYSTEISGFGLADLLDYLHRLRVGRLYRQAGPHKKAVLDHVISWLEASYRHHAREDYVQLTGEQRRQSSLRAEKEADEMFDAIRKSGAKTIIFTDRPIFRWELLISLLLMAALIVTFVTAAIFG